MTEEDEAAAAEGLGGALLGDLGLGSGDGKGSSGARTRVSAERTGEEEGGQRNGGRSHISSFSDEVEAEYALLFANGDSALPVAENHCSCLYLFLIQIMDQ